MQLAENIPASVQPVETGPMPSFDDESSGINFDAYKEIKVN